MKRDRAADWLRTLVDGLDDPGTAFREGYQTALRDMLAMMDGQAQSVCAAPDAIGVTHTARLARMLT